MTGNAAANPVGPYLSDPCVLSCPFPLPVQTEGLQGVVVNRAALEFVACRKIGLLHEELAVRRTSTRHLTSNTQQQQPLLEEDAEEEACHLTPSRLPGCWLACLTRLLSACCARRTAT